MKSHTTIGRTLVVAALAAAIAAATSGVALAQAKGSGGPGDSSACNKDKYTMNRSWGYAMDSANKFDFGTMAVALNDYQKASGEYDADGCKPA